MTQDEIIEMAEQVGMIRRTDEFHSDFCDGVYGDELEAFSKLVEERAATKEREACAKVCEDYGLAEEMQAIGNDFAQAIRARGQA